MVVSLPLVGPRDGVCTPKAEVPWAINGADILSAERSWLSGQSVLTLPQAGKLPSDESPSRVADLWLPEALLTPSFHNPSPESTSPWRRGHVSNSGLRKPWGLVNSRLSAVFDRLLISISPSHHHSPVTCGWSTFYMLCT